MISNNLLLELRQIIKEEYGVVLNLQEVTEIGMSLLTFIEALLKIEAKNDYEKQKSIKTS